MLMVDTTLSLKSLQTEKEQVVHFELQIIYRNNNNVFNIACWPQNLTQPVNILIKVIFTVN